MEITNFHIEYELDKRHFVMEGSYTQTIYCLIYSNPQAINIRCELFKR